MARLHELFAEKTLVCTVTAASELLRPSEQTFGEAMAAVGRKVARQRLLDSPDAEASVPYFVERCAVCGHRAASRLQRRRTEEGRPECEPCFQAVRRGKDDTFYEEEPDDFKNLADGQGYYAVLYLDGNGIGRTIRGLRNPLEYRIFSQAVSELMGGAFGEVAKRYRLEDSPTRRLRDYQKPIAGGDDVVAILPAEIAVPFARDLLSEIEQRCDASEVKTVRGLGASAGVALAQVTFPIRHLLVEAEALLELAKRRVYADEVRSALDFAVVRDGSPRSESVVRERWARPEEEMLLSGKPYSLPELQTFSQRLDTVLATSEVGRTQLYALRRYSAAGPSQLRNHILYQVGRRGPWQQLVKDLAGSDLDLTDPDRCVEVIVPSYGNQRVCDVADMIELFNHWPKPEEGDRS
jgi:hypothetical protein